MKKWTFGGVVVSFLALSLGAMPYGYAASSKVHKWTVDLDHGSGNVEFRATGRPSALKIVGKGPSPKGSFAVDADQVSGSAIFDLTSLDTGIKLRNEHMKEKYLEVAKYPNAKLSLTKLSLPKGQLAGDFSADQIPFEGVLSLHGVDKSVSGVATVERKADRLKLLATFSLVIDDYKIPTPGFSGITMAKDVQVSVESISPIVVKQ